PDAGPSVAEVQLAGGRQTLPDLARDAAEDMQLAPGCVAEAEPQTNVIAVRLLEGRERREPRRRREPDLAGRNRRWLRSRAPARCGYERDRRQAEDASPHGSESAIGCRSGPAPSGAASCPSPA